MKLSVKIWLLAIVYQVIIFGFMLDTMFPIALILIPIGLVGGFPGLLIFDVILKNLQKNSDSIYMKWCYIIFTAIFAASVSAALPMILLGIVVNHPTFEWLPFLPAPAAALAALFSFTIPLHKSFLASSSNNKNNTISL